MGFFTECLRPAATAAFVTTTTNFNGCASGVGRLSGTAFSIQKPSSPVKFYSTVKTALHSQQQQPSAKATTKRPSYTTHPAFNDDVIDQYDAFVLDQFGVMHNGINALEGAVALVEYLFHKKKKKLIILSNTSAPAEKALAKLPKFGFDPSHFIGAVTSGEEASHYIRETYGSNTGTGGSSSKALFITWDTSNPDNPRLTALPEAFLDQCGAVEIATSVEEAVFLLLHGSEVWYRGPDMDAQSLAPFIEHCIFDKVDPILEQCRAKNLPAVCANPDFVVQTPSGDGVAYMPGKIAERYQAMGGSCQTFGKPAVEHFEACIRKLGLEKSRVAHVGDSLHHDISGAAKAGIPNVFVTSGIHQTDLGTKFGELPDPKSLEALMEQEVASIRPTHVVPAFRL